MSIKNKRTLLGVGIFAAAAVMLAIMAVVSAQSVVNWSGSGTGSDGRTFVISGSTTTRPLTGVISVTLGAKRYAGMVITESPPPSTQPTPPVTQPSAGTLPDGTPMPGPTNTGPVAGTVLTPSNVVNVTVAGTVLQNQSFTNQVIVTAPNVQFLNDTFNFPSTLENTYGLWFKPGANNPLVKNCTFTGGGPGTYQINQQSTGGQYLNLCLYDTPKSLFYLSGSATIKNSWAYQVGWNGMGVTSNPNKPTFTGTDHVDVVYFESGTSLVVENNNFSAPGKVPVKINGVWYNGASALIFGSPYGAGDDTLNVTVNNNYLDGGSYIFQFDGETVPTAGSTTVGPFNITNNILGPDEEVGYMDSYIGGSWTWGGNVDPTGKTIPIPTGVNIAGTAPSN